MKKRVRWLIIPIVSVVLAATLVYGFSTRTAAPGCDADTDLPVTTLQTGSTLLQAEVASSGDDQTRGLSGRDCLGRDRAMLFPYPTPGDYCYWMKDMKFAIDMIWLDDEKKIVTIKDHVSPDTYPQTFCPERPAQYVVEVSAGTAKRLNLQTGAQFEFSL